MLALGANSASAACRIGSFSSIENLQLLGENYIKQMKRDLTPLTFQTSILCQRIGIAKESLLEHRTDGTDAFDTLYIGCEKFPQHTASTFPVGGVL